MSVRGRFLWYDLITPDKDAAVAFYTDVVAWTITAWEGQQDYAMWTAADGAPMGGVVQRDEGHQWMGYLGVDDVDIGVELVQAMGGSIVRPPFDMEGVGRAAVIADPGGAVISLFTPKSVPGAADASGPGHVSWFDLAAHRPERTMPFWLKLMDWTDVDTMKSPMGKYMMVGPDRAKPALGGMYAAPEGMPAGWTFYITVASLDASVERVRSGGGQVLRGPMAVPDGDRVAQCLDPQGLPFALHESKAG